MTHNPESLSNLLFIYKQQADSGTTNQIFERLSCSILLMFVIQSYLIPRYTFTTYCISSLPIAVSYTPSIKLKLARGISTFKIMVQFSFKVKIWRLKQSVQRYDLYSLFFDGFDLTMQCLLQCYWRCTKVQHLLIVFQYKHSRTCFHNLMMIQAHKTILEFYFFLNWDTEI